MSKSKKNQKKETKRNWLAVHAFQRGCAGNHGDNKKQSSKRACRGRIQV